MKSKIVLVLLFIILVTGCGTKVIVDGPVNTSYNEKDVVARNPKFNCPVLDKIKLMYIGNSYFITNDGNLYKIGNFSDKTNCKLVESDIKFNRIINSFLIDEDNNMYSLEEDDVIKKYEYTSNYEHVFNVGDFVKVYGDYVNDINGKYVLLVLKTDGIIYRATQEYVHTIDKYVYKLTDLEEYVKYDNEKILDFSMYYNDKLSWAKTDKSYYRVTLNNKDCEKYDDIKCEQVLKKDDYLSSRYDKIAYVYNCSSTYDKCNYILKDGGRYEDHIGG